MTGTDIIYVGIAYLLGGICFGYYLVRIKCGIDIRDHVSGGVGARNVGRMLGKLGFMITLLGDALKGVAAVILAKSAHVSPPALSLVLFAVIAGHIWPPLLGFRGGRGIATAIGAYLSYNPLFALVLLVITLCVMVFRRGFILSGLTAFLLLPFVALAMKCPAHTTLSLTACSVAILFAHRERIRNVFAPALTQKEV